MIVLLLERDDLITFLHVAKKLQQSPDGVYIFIAVDYEIGNQSSSGAIADEIYGHTLVQKFSPLFIT